MTSDNENSTKKLFDLANNNILQGLELLRIVQPMFQELLGEVDAKNDKVELLTKANASLKKATDNKIKSLQAEIKRASQIKYSDVSRDKNKKALQTLKAELAAKEQELVSKEQQLASRERTRREMKKRYESLEILRTLRDSSFCSHNSNIDGTCIRCIAIEAMQKILPIIDSARERINKIIIESSSTGDEGEAKLVAERILERLD